MTITRHAPASWCRGRQDEQRRTNRLVGQLPTRLVTAPSQQSSRTFASTRRGLTTVPPCSDGGDDLSGKNSELARSLGADVVVDYKREDFAEVLSGYDVVMESLGGENLEKSLAVLKAGGQAISVTGPPDPDFASSSGRRSSWAP